ncbi:MAG: hypothetical protein DRI39_07705 [Chloroflexi bacterium]|nr:MAG: hypothetical protein DRI39_07705 [Chloroflexota bacterium]
MTQTMIFLNLLVAVYGWLVHPVGWGSALDGLGLRHRIAAGPEERQCARLPGNGQNAGKTAISGSFRS